MVDEDWFDNVQEEICNAITESGITLDSGDRGQLSDAIRNPTTVTTGGIAVNDADNSTDSITIKGVATSGSGTGATVNILSARGTLGSPTSISLGDELGRVGFGGASASGTWSAEKAYVSAGAAQAWSASQMGTYVTIGATNLFSTAPDIFLTLDWNGLSLTSTYEYQYSAAKSYTSFFSLLNGTANANAVFSGLNNTSQSVGGTTSAVLTLNANGSVLVPLNFPTGAMINEVTYLSTIGSSGGSLVVELRTSTTNVMPPTTTLQEKSTRTSGVAQATAITVSPPLTASANNLIYLVLTNVGTASITLSPFIGTAYTLQTLTSERQG